MKTLSTYVWDRQVSQERGQERRGGPPAVVGSCCRGEGAGSEVVAASPVGKEWPPPGRPRLEKKATEFRTALRYTRKRKERCAVCGSDGKPASNRREERGALSYPLAAAAAHPKGDGPRACDDHAALQLAPGACQWYAGFKGACVCVCENAAASQPRARLQRAQLRSRAPESLAREVPSPAHGQLGPT